MGHHTRLSPKAVSTFQCPMRERLVASAGRVEHVYAPIAPPDVATRFATDRDRGSAEHARVLRLAVPLLPQQRQGIPSLGVAPGLRRHGNLISSQKMEAERTPGRLALQARRRTKYVNSPPLTSA